MEKQGGIVQHNSTKKACAPSNMKCSPQELPPGYDGICAACLQVALMEGVLPSMLAEADEILAQMAAVTEIGLERGTPPNAHQSSEVASGSSSPLLQTSPKRSKPLTNENAIEDAHRGSKLAKYRQVLHSYTKNECAYLPTNSTYQLPVLSPCADLFG